MTTKNLQPGVGIMVVDDTVPRVVCATRKRSNRIRQMTWLKLQGRQGATIRIVSLYRSCHSDRPKSVNQHHRRYMPKMNRTEELRDLFKKLVWREEGNQLIIGMDANTRIIQSC
jgi:hypothetical protein